MEFDTNKKKLSVCPICNRFTYDYSSYKEECWGSMMVVEQYGYCSSCGYILQQSYSPEYQAFMDNKRGRKKYNGEYVEKDVKRHKRIRRKLDVTEIEVNPSWVFH